MEGKRFRWRGAVEGDDLVLVYVPGTSGTPYQFGSGACRKAVYLAGFYIGATPVTQALWEWIMGDNPSVYSDRRCPVENVSWQRITEPGGFLDRINASEAGTAIRGNETNLRFRLPSESEWEYA
jgi:formylglycine-generating enzyme required for sulfatase activity